MLKSLILSLNSLDVGVLATYLYVGLSFFTLYQHTRQHVSGWGLNSFRKLLGFYTYYKKALYVKCFVDAILVLEGLYAWYCWGNNHRKKRLPVTVLSWGEGLLLFVLGVWLGRQLGWCFAIYTTAHKPYLDGLHAVFVMITYGLLAHKKREAWLFWLVANLAYMWLFVQDVISVHDVRDGALFLKYMGYLFLSVRGYQKWQKSYEQNKVVRL